MDGWTTFRCFWVPPTSVSIDYSRKIRPHLVILDQFRKLGIVCLTRQYTVRHEVRTELLAVYDQHILLLLVLDLTNDLTILANNVFLVLRLQEDMASSFKLPLDSI
jgi:hypothetical protein